VPLLRYRCASRRARQGIFAGPQRSGTSRAVGPSCLGPPWAGCIASAGEPSYLSQPNGRISKHISSKFHLFRIRPALSTNVTDGLIDGD